MANFIRDKENIAPVAGENYAPDERHEHLIAQLVHALRDAEEIIVRASLTFKDANGNNVTHDMNDTVGQRLGIIVGILNYWEVMNGNGQTVLMGGFPKEVAPVVFESIDSTPLSVRVNEDKYIVSGDKFVIHEKMLIGTGDSFGGCLGIINDHYRAENP